MDGLDSGYRLTTGMELGDIVFHYSLNCREQTKGIIEGSNVSDVSRCSGHEVFPVVLCDLTIPESEEDVTEENLTGVLSCLSHDLI